MLRTLTMEEFVLFARETVPFSAGLNVLSGETGAGKSLLLDALGFISGARADASMVRQGAEQARVIAEFTTPEHCYALLAELDIPAEETLVIRRSLTREGKSKAFVNDVPVNVGTLRRLGVLLIAQHGQHDQQGLLDADNHRVWLDDWLAQPKLRMQLIAAYREFAQAKQALAALEAMVESATRERAYLEHTVSELAQLAPEEGEELALAEARAIAMKQHKAREALQGCVQLLEERNSPASQLLQCEKLLARSGLDETVSAPIFAPLHRAQQELELLREALANLTRSEEDEQTIEAKEERLFALRAAARKYHVSVDGLANLLAESREKLRVVAEHAQAHAHASEMLAHARTAYSCAAEAQYAARETAWPKLAAALTKELKALKMGDTQLRVVQTMLPETQWGEAGMHRVEFEVSTNKGQPFAPLAKVASGGELSRLLLALHVVLTQAHAATSIYDEIDAGTGGAVAEAIGQRLKRVSANTQVLVVTHLPQVAAQADHHLRIHKRSKKAVTVTEIETLDAQAREEELARMISGAVITDEARIAAKKLMQVA